ncbi:hypothetical protein EUTSA_v10023621mg [Eutrema salsugineum]|uniref:NYN domain-containing protein n=1 Tax=Eutrema salsugineum TaxID=72664 RepID=V4KDH0_EUTSA|nr:hypothetical protein EUTSA_v10023621mg [Eutrema salsugineum]
MNWKITKLPPSSSTSSATFDLISSRFIDNCRFSLFFLCFLLPLSYFPVLPLSHFPSPMSREKKKRFVPLGDISLLSHHKERQKKKEAITAEDRQTKVQLIWDFNTAPLRDIYNGNEYDVSQFIHSINRGLRHVNDNLRVDEETTFAAGDTDLLKPSDLLSIKSLFKEVVHCKDRDYLCKPCRDSAAAPPVKTTDEVMFTLQEKLLGDAILRGSPGVILLISADYDFHPSLDYLRRDNFIILLAQADDSHLDYRNHGHYTFIWKNLRVGEPPTYECTNFKAIDGTKGDGDTV